MRIAILSEKPNWHVEDLRRAAVARGHGVVTCSWRALAGAVGVEGGATAVSEGIRLDDMDAVLLRTMPAGTLEQVVFRMDLLQRLARRGVVVMNPPRAVEAAVDKYLALSRIAGAGLSVPPTFVCQRISDGLRAFDQLGGDVVIKPLFGSEGIGMTRITDRDLASRAFGLLERMQSVIYAQKFLDAVADLRLFVIEGRVVASMRRVGENWRSNIARGGRGEPYDADAALCDVAVRAAGACDAIVAGVDVLIDDGGAAHVLEVNASPGWRALNAVTGVAVAPQIVACVERRVAAGAEAATHG